MLRGLRLPSIDPFLVWLVSTVLTASLFPVTGRVAAAFDVLASLAIALLFFLHGAKLSRQAILEGIGNWRLHLLVLSSTYVLFPIAGLAASRLAVAAGVPVIAPGVLFLTLLPSTVQASIAFTAMAGGNVAAAVCSASLSNLLGMVMTPLLVGLMMQAGGHGEMISTGAVRSIALQLLFPFVAGHLLRPVIGGFVDRHRRMLQVVDRGSILLVVFSAFSAAVVNGIWHLVALRDLLVLLVLAAGILAAIMSANALTARLAGLPREDAIVLFFCGSKKSLVSGVPMAGTLFPAAQVGVMVLPLMLFHQLQLFACAWMAARFRRVDEESAPVIPLPPQGEVEALAAARAIDLPIPDACLPGVVANLALLTRHAQTLTGNDLP